MRLVLNVAQPNTTKFNISTRFIYAKLLHIYIYGLVLSVYNTFITKRKRRHYLHDKQITRESRRNSQVVLFKFHKFGRQQELSSSGQIVLNISGQELKIVAWRQINKQEEVRFKIWTEMFNYRVFLHVWLENVHIVFSSHMFYSGRCLSQATTSSPESDKNWVIGNCFIDVK